jgi:uncharacterized membrane protein YfcA
MLISNATVIAALVVIAFGSGIGITAIGPGGVFLTIALYALTPLPPSTIAGTAQLLFIVTGLIAALAYVRSGELTRESAPTAALLSGGSIGGALFGAWLNGFVSRELFGLLLGVLAGTTGLIILYRERRSLDAIVTLNPMTLSGAVSYVVLGFALGGFSGLLGVGGPIIAVPALVVIGTPMLLAVAIAQIQSVFISSFAVLGYLSKDAVSLSLAAIVGIPLFVGVIVGWLVAHRIDPRRLKALLAIVLLIVAPYLAL